MIFYIQLHKIPLTPVSVQMSKTQSKHRWNQHAVRDRQRRTHRSTLHTWSVCQLLHCCSGPVSMKQQASQTNLLPLLLRALLRALSPGLEDVLDDFQISLTLGWRPRIRSEPQRPLGQGTILSSPAQILSSQVHSTVSPETPALLTGVSCSRWDPHNKIFSYCIFVFFIPNVIYLNNI